MDDVDKALEALKIQIKKEIIDHYFAERRYLEEENEALEAEVAGYQEKRAALKRAFWALYAVLSQKAAIARLMELLSLGEWPFYQEFEELPPSEREKLAARHRRFGFTAKSRRYHQLEDIYQELQQISAHLKERYEKLLLHLELLNEDIQKFNRSFDFGLIAAQLEAMEGGASPLGGGLLSSEREELSTRMRFKLRKLPPEKVPPPPALPSWEEIKERVRALL